MKKSARPVQEFKPRYSFPKKKQHHWFCNKLGLRFTDPDDLRELERETLIAVKEEIERELSELRSQIDIENTRHHQEINRLADSRAFMMSLVNAAHEGIREARKQRLKDNAAAQKLWERAFIQAARDTLTDEQYSALLRKADRSIDPSSDD